MSDDKMRETEQVVYNILWDMRIAPRHQIEQAALVIANTICASNDAEIADSNGSETQRMVIHQLEQQLAAKDAKIKVALDKFSHIKWIKDCGIDSSQGNHPEDERDAMYKIANEAIAQIEVALK